MLLPEACIRVIDQIAPLDPFLAGYLEKMVENFRFDLLKALPGEESS